MGNRKILLWLSISALLFTALGGPLGMASSHGKEGLSTTGCTCHSGGPDTAVVNINGVPETYVPGEVYDLEIELLGGPEVEPNAHRGGFNLAVSAGTLSTKLSAFDVQITKKGEPRHDGDAWETTGEATHTHSGANQRKWSLMWTAPGPGVGEALFTVAGNIVEGDHQPSGDSWALNSTTSLEGERTFSQWLGQNIAPILFSAMVLVVALMWYKRKASS